MVKLIEHFGAYLEMMNVSDSNGVYLAMPYHPF